MATREIVDEAEKKPLSFDDLRKMLGPDAADTKLISYDELKAEPSLETLFGEKKAVIILLEIEAKNAPKVGHWIALLNKPNNIEHFDPYGFSVDQELAITHESDFLGTLFRRSDKKIVTNKRRFQKIRPDSIFYGSDFTVAYQKPYAEFISEANHKHVKQFNKKLKKMTLLEWKQAVLKSYFSGTYDEEMMERSKNAL